MEPAKGAQPPERLALMYLASLATGAESGLSFCPPGLLLAPDLKRFLAQLLAELTHLVLKAIRVPSGQTFCL